jgi:hypothetical protein
MTGSARLAAILLLAVWLGPVSFAQTDAWQLLKWAGAPAPAAAESQVIPAGQALVLSAGTLLKLVLADGSVVEGRFLGRTLLDSTLYAKRFDRYAQTSAFVPFALGETLHVALHDGREWIAPFAGFGELTVLLENPDGLGVLRVPFEFAKEFRGANGAWVQPKALMKAFRKGSLPSAEALALGDRGAVPGSREAWDSALRVAVQDIKSATAELPSGGSATGVVLISVVASVVVLWLILAALSHPYSTGCNTMAIPNVFQGMSVRLTAHPFDRERSCYADDSPPVAEVWTGEGDPAPPAAAIAPATPAPAAIPDEATP